MLSVYALSYAFSDAAGKAEKLKSALRAQSEGRLLLDETPGLAIFQSSATSQALLEMLREATAWAEGDMLLILNLTRPEYAQQGVRSQERLAFLMQQRAQTVAALLAG